MREIGRKISSRSTQVTLSRLQIAALAVLISLGRREALIEPVAGLRGPCDLLCTYLQGTVWQSLVHAGLGWREKSPGKKIRVSGPCPQASREQE